MAKSRKNRKSRFEGINLDTLNQEVAKVTNQKLNTELELDGDELESNKPLNKEIKEIKKDTPKRGKGRPKSSNRRPLNTAIEPKNRQRLEFLAMLNGGSVADQLNNILEKYFTEIEKVDELIDIFEARKKKR